MLRRRRSDAWVAGVDGCRGGWVAVFRHARTGDVVWGLFPSIRDVLSAPERPRVVAVDMPIGLLDGARPGGRGPETELRRRLAVAGRAACVFTPPVRAALAATSHATANRINRASSSHRLGLSRQAYNLSSKLAELDRLMTPRLQARVREAHPELAFALMNAGRPLAQPKKSKAGSARRAALLRRHGFAAVVRAARRLPRRYAAPDDLLDAAALARTALRILKGEAMVLPARPPRDAHGLRMEIWG